MARFKPHLAFITLSLLVWALWDNKIYPFTISVFTDEGYGIHFVGGMGYAALQVLLTQALLPMMHFTPRFFTAQTAISIGFLGILELTQVTDPTRKVQLGDVAWQSLGVLVCILILWLCERRHSFE